MAETTPVTVGENVEPTAVEAEFYPTPAWVIDRMVEAVPLPPGDYLDPCVGDGAIPAAMRGPLWTAIDIRDTGHVDHVASYFSLVLPPFECCVMNPPFSQALRFVDKAISHCNVVVMLQRLNWLGTEDRADWLRAHTPAVYVLPNRCDFTGGGGDSAEYAWFVWGLGSSIHILNTTPLHIRNAQKPTAPVDRQTEMFT